ncbi:hypothetical protein BC831DRAFT_110501 [Entophlyctis helioformis]|nr:hypothetical protein BC831DRAFT_110501 [Entophlyctis helioformis]
MRQTAGGRRRGRGRGKTCLGTAARSPPSSNVSGGHSLHAPPATATRPLAVLVVLVGVRAVRQQTSIIAKRQTDSQPARRYPWIAQTRGICCQPAVVGCVHGISRQRRRHAYLLAGWPAVWLTGGWHSNTQLPPAFAHATPRHDTPALPLCLLEMCHRLPNRIRFQLTPRLAAAVASARTDLPPDHLHCFASCRIASTAATLTALLSSCRPAQSSCRHSLP